LRRLRPPRILGVVTVGSVRAFLGPYYLPTPLVTGVEPRDDMPVEFALHPARSNPCRQFADLSYDLPASARVRLALCDVQGRRVRTLVDGVVVEAGRQRIVWDARDDGGHRLRSGVYQFRLEAGANGASGRVVLLP